MDSRTHARTHAHLKNKEPFLLYFVFFRHFFLFLFDLHLNITFGIWNKVDFDLKQGWKGEEVRGRDDLGRKRRRGKGNDLEKREKFLFSGIEPFFFFWASWVIYKSKIIGRLGKQINLFNLFSLPFSFSLSLSFFHTCTIYHFQNYFLFF